MGLGGAMRMMNRGFRDLKANVGDASKREENLTAVWTMQQGCAAAKRGKPDHLEGDPVAGVETFRREQIKLMGMLVTLEAAIMDNNTDEAKATLAEMKEFQEESHDKYKVKEEDVEGADGPGGPGGPQGPGEHPPQPRSGR
jgi:soluble cytochrome b562